MTWHFWLDAFAKWGAYGFRFNGKPEPTLDDHHRMLIECYRSGQISEAAWQEHLDTDPKLREKIASQRASKCIYVCNIY